MFTQVRYILNMIFFAIPYTLIGAALIIWNLVCNIWFNEGWAGANIWLIWNTVFLIGQYLMGILLYWEIDLWIHYAKFPRFISLIMGLVSDIWWISELIIMYGIIGDWDNSHVTYTYLYTAMILSYDLIMHVNVLPINVLLFLKEFTMEFFQFANNVAGTEFDDWSLGFSNFLNMFKFMFDLVNPWWWSSDEKWFWE
jgi:hypothetical protein